MNIEDIKKRVKDEEFPLIERAFNFANNKLLGLYYSKDETLINHILHVVNTLIDFNADSYTIISSLLYETIKNGVSKDEIEKEFGSNISSIAYKTSIISNKDFIDQKIYLEQLSADSPIDVRACFIKLANNFYTIKTTTGEYQKQLSIETLSILIPTAGRLNFNYIKSKLEDLCFLSLNKDAYNDILNKLNATPDMLKIYLENIKNDISNLLMENGFNCIVKARVKNFYSIYNKLMNGKKWEEIYDILGLRVIVDDEAQCREIAELIHSKYKYLPTRYKDYIKNPKENMYQSLHTTIVDENNRIYEVQIRTSKMNKTAEVGSASHQLYKEKTLKKVKFF